MAVSFLYVTTPSVKVAKNISKVLIKEKLIACANILPKMESIYVWKGKVENAKECVLLLKTTTKNVKKVRVRVEKLHPYEVPCIAEIKIGSLNRKYQDWIEDLVKT